MTSTFEALSQRARSALIVFEHGVYEADAREDAMALGVADFEARDENSIQGMRADALIYRGSPGSRLGSCALQAVRLARELGIGIAGISFNGAHSLVDAGSSAPSEELASAMETDYHAQQDASYQAYLNSAKGRADQRATALRQELARAKEGEARDRLALALKSPQALCGSEFYAALGEWIQAADSWDAPGERKKEVLEGVLAAGIVADEGVGSDAVVKRKEPIACARYYAGQYVSMAQSGKGLVHPLIGERLCELARSGGLEPKEPVAERVAKGAPKA